MRVVRIPLLLLFSWCWSGYTQAQEPVSVSGTINFNSEYTLLIQPIGLDNSLIDSLDENPGELTLSQDGKFEWAYTIKEPGLFQAVFLRKARDRQLGATFPLYLRPGEALTLHLHYDDSTYLSLLSGSADPTNCALISYSGFSQRAKRANFIEPPGDSELPLTAKAYVDEARALLRRTGVVSPQAEQYLMTWAWNDYLDLLFSRRGNPAPLDKNLFPETLVTVLDSETMLLFYEGYMNINRYLDYRLRGLDHGDRLEYIQAKIEYTKRHFTNQRITDMVIGRNLENFVTRYTVRSTDSFEQNRERLAALVQLSSDTAHRNRILAHFDNLRYTQEGSLMPDAVFKDARGNPVRLQDFAGKYVYIDLWASWCVPCIREIPHLQQLEKQYNSEDIVFVSISLDKDKKAWHNKMAELNLSGHQWELGESRYDKVMNVVGIPHFLLYGPDGRLIKYRATRPSSPETTKLFDSLF